MLENHYGSSRGHLQMAKTLIILGNAYAALGIPHKEKEFFEGERLPLF